MISARSRSRGPMAIRSMASLAATTLPRFDFLRRLFLRGFRQSDDVAKMNRRPRRATTSRPSMSSIAPGASPSMRRRRMGPSSAPFASSRNSKSASLTLLSQKRKRESASATTSEAL